MKGIYILAGLSIFWFALTVWVQFAGKQYSNNVTDRLSSARALIVYKPDPIYDMDKQLCSSLALGLKKHGFSSRIITTGLVSDEDFDADLYVVCTNTYNFAPDWKMSNFIQRPEIKTTVPVAAMTLGAGSTKRAKRLWDKKIQSNKLNLVDSREFWLMKPNNEESTEERNVALACHMTMQWGEELGKRFSK